MRMARYMAAPTVLLLLSQAAFAEEVDLPAPVLEWSFYILLIFSACVALGTSMFQKRKNEPYETLGSVLKGKARAVHSVLPDTSVTECVRQMNELEIGAMLIIEDEQLLGIFTERDAITRVLGKGLDAMNTRVSDVMTKDPISVSASTSLEDAMKTVTQRRIRHLPVVEDDKVFAVVSSGDLTHRLLEL